LASVRYRKAKEVRHRKGPIYKGTAGGGHGKAGDVPYRKAREVRHRKGPMYKGTALMALASVRYGKAGDVRCRKGPIEQGEATSPGASNVIGDAPSHRDAGLRVTVTPGSESP
jgi:hypothetical protein